MCRPATHAVLGCCGKLCGKIKGRLKPYLTELSDGLWQVTGVVWNVCVALGRYLTRFSDGLFAAEGFEAVDKVEGLAGGEFVGADVGEGADEGFAVWVWRCVFRRPFCAIRVFGCGAMEAV